MSVTQAVVYWLSDDVKRSSEIAAQLAACGLRCVAVRTCEELAAGVSPQGAGCVVIESGQPARHGLALQRQVASLALPLAIVFVAERGDVQTAVEAMRGGAEAVLERPFDEAALLTGLQRALDAGRSLTADSQRHGEILRRLNDLSAKERSVLDLVLAGEPNKAIAAKLKIAQRTVERLRSLILKRLDTTTAIELARKVAEARVWAESCRASYAPDCSVDILDVA